MMQVFKMESIPPLLKGENTAKKALRLELSSHFGVSRKLH